jgi:hypothetical protein
VLGLGDGPKRRQPRPDRAQALDELHAGPYHQCTWS